MSFALPIALALAALTLPIVALYILKVRLRRVPVSTNMFWKQIYEEKPPRSLWQHFRHLVSLLLQLLLLLLITLAAADPYFSWQILQARRLVVVVDNSASMRADDVKPTRLDAAKDAAIGIIDGLRFRDQMSIVLAGSTPEVVIGMTGHAPTLRDAVKRIQFSDNSTTLDTAIELGHRLIGQHPHGQILVLTDGCVDAIPLSDADKSSTNLSPAQPTADSPAAVQAPEARPDDPQTPRAKTSERATVTYRLFASEARNIGITQLQVRRSLVDPLGYEILASVRNASTAPVACRLELTLNDIPVDVIPLKLGPDELWSRSLEKTSLEGGPLKAVLTQISTNMDDDASGDNKKPAPTASTDNKQLDVLATDNSAWALLPARKPQKVLLVTQGNLFLQKVFEANPLVEVTVRKDFPEQWPTDSIIVLHGLLPPTLPSGNVFAIDTIGSCDQWEQGDLLENPIVTDQDKSSPLMTHIRLDNVLVPQARQLQFRSPPHSLAKTLSGEIVYAEVRRSNGKCLALSVNLDSSDLAFRTAFPILIANSLGWFAGTTGELQASLPTGSVTTLTLATKASHVSLLSPGSSLTSAACSVIKTSETESSVTVGPLNETGLWELSPAEPGVGEEAEVPGGIDPFAQLAVNLANERESDLRPLKGLVESPQSQMVASSGFSKPIWFYLIVLACVLTCIEWFLYNRRFIS
ncbi:MAG: VWA domain-containing protein [Planctomycetaceae bacterium]